MPANRIILGDLGGTRLRLAQGGVSNVKTINPSDYPSLQAALSDYAADTKNATLLLSFARRGDVDGVYKMDQPHKKGVWDFKLDDIKRDCGFAHVEVLHDMQAMGRGVFRADAFTQIGGGKVGEGWRTIINVGTGLGHAFCDPENKTVRDSFGGHFPPAAVTHEQREAVRLIEAQFHEGRSFIWEEILSGRGLEVLDAQTMDGARLFCEFLGLYANAISISAHAFGGVYLCGGVIEHMFDDGRFDVNAFMKFFVLHNVPVVDQSLTSCPVYRASLSHTALYGLDIYAQSLSHD